MPPFTGVAVKLTVVPAQIAVCDPVIEVAGVRTGFTVITTLLLVTETGDAHAALELIVHVSVFVPAGNTVVEYVAEVAPVTGLPFRFHWYVGVPPFVCEEENNTPVPEQIAAGDVVLAEIVGVTALPETFTIISVRVEVPHELLA